MKNTVLDLNNHLFAQLERLNDESIKGEQLKQEIERSKAISGVAREVISNGRLVLDAEALRMEGGKVPELPEFLLLGKK